ncbi:hypothetical protein [Pseudonocardia parietis]|uniref:Small CPxCG-related zinc finger protein n=1 Tax=Pseudonocardia parietis TaxID=570936 RepID=A0ABS4VQY4_9PSEU|nr:hypothetical protein [Pseudonocardia parietis]MBP2366332.1 hypothetical protein [Pseudonocardia parietis]
MDENAEHPTGRTGTGTPDASRCTCCGRRGAREPLRLSGPGTPAYVAACPYCDLQPAETQGWLDEIVRDGS